MGSGGEAMIERTRKLSSKLSLHRKYYFFACFLNERTVIVVGFSEDIFTFTSSKSESTHVPIRGYYFSVGQFWKIRETLGRLKLFSEQDTTITLIFIRCVIVLS